MQDGVNTNDDKLLTIAMVTYKSGPSDDSDDDKSDDYNNDN